MRRDVKAIIWLFLIVLSTSYTVFAQGSFGSIRGTITDTAGAAVAGATVEVKNQETNETRTVTTGSQGDFIVNNLNPGSYSISASSQGFSAATAKDVRVSVAFTTEQNVTLNPAGSEASVTVTTGDAATQINTSDQQLSTIITNQKIQDLPLLSRDPSSLVLLAPGTVQTDSGLGGFSVNGSRERNNNFMVDGVDNNDTDVPGIPGGIATPNIDATEEFRVITGNFNAEFGRNTGGVITVATKRGTNLFHGNAYLYYRSDKYAARNFFEDDKAPLDRKQYGGSIGGPIWKDKAFFFFNYEGNKSKIGNPQFRVVPTAAARTGVFTTAAFGTLDIRPGGANNITGAILGLPNNLPFNPITVGILNALYPLPNYPTNGAVPAPLPGAFELYSFNFTQEDKIDSIAARTDFLIANKHNLTLSVNYGKGDYSLFAPTFDTTDDEARTPQKGGVYALNLVSTFNSNMVNEFRFGTNRATADFNGTGDGTVSNAINEAVNGIFTSGGAQLSSFGPANARALNLVTPFTSIVNFDTQSRKTGTTTIGDSFTLVKNTHTFKFGGEARLVFSDGQSNFGRQETLDFGVAANFGAPFVVDNDGNALDTTGIGLLVNDYLSFLSGVVAVQTQNQFFGKDGQRDENDLRRYRTNEYSLFFQDSWRIRPDLTLNLGVRYDYNTTPYEKDGLLSNLVNQDASGVAPVDGFEFLTVGKNSDNPNIPLYKADKNNFAPRIGFAYSPSFKDGFLGKIFGGPGMSSFRGGFGVFYDRVFTNLFGNSSANAPFSLAQQNLPVTTDTFLVNQVTRVAVATPSNRVFDGDEGAAVIFPTDANNILQSKFKTPTSNSWNFGFQRDLGNNFLIEADYVGTKGSHLIRSADALMTSVRRVNAITGANNPFSLNLRTNYLNGTLNTAFGQQGAFLIVSTGNSRYDSMQLRVTKTLTNKKWGLGQLQAFYTWGHSIDDAPDALVTGAGDRSLPRDSSGYSGGFQAERGDSSFDVRHRFVSNFIYELPFFRGDSWVDKLAGNWVISGIYQAQTGFPISIFSNGIDRQGTGVSSRATYASGGNAYTSTQTPDNTRNYTGPSRTLFASTVVADGNQGNVGRSTFRGPKFSKFDFSVIKRFPINETMRFSIRADFFNLFNTVNFAVPITDTTSPNFGVSVAAAPARIIQFAGRFDF